MRLQVFLAKAGIASRRGAIDIIKSGKISVNGDKVFVPSFNIDQGKDKIFFNDKRISSREKVYIMLNKPKGVTTTKKDPFAKKTVMELLPGKYRHLNPVGRLDKDTTGLLLLTNDGEFINKLTHPRYNVKKTYSAVLDKKLSLSGKTNMEKGVFLDGKNTAACAINIKAENTVEITIHEGRKRQVKRMFSKTGYTVTELKRLKEGALCLGDLPEASWRFLTKEEIMSFPRKRESIPLDPRFRGDDTKLRSIR
jgi:23S rRNA pseudouridine2605 synthase